MKKINEHFEKIWLAKVVVPGFIATSGDENPAHVADNLVDTLTQDGVEHEIYNIEIEEAKIEHFDEFDINRDYRPWNTKYEFSVYDILDNDGLAPRIVNINGHFYQRLD